MSRERYFVVRVERDPYSRNQRIEEKRVWAESPEQAIAHALLPHAHFGSVTVAEESR